MIKLKDILLNEWADEIVLQGDEDKTYATYRDSDALPFVISADLEIIDFGNPTNTHAEMGHRREKGGIQGRVWFKKKILSFWEYPETMQKLNTQVQLINNSEASAKYEFKINPTWVIDIPLTPKDISSDAYLKYVPGFHSALIPIQAYDPEILKSKAKIKLIKKIKQRHKLRESKTEPSATNYARAAIRDIFIQMTTRSVSVENWKGFKNFIIGNYGKKAYIEAIKDLKKDGWLTIKDGWYQWKKEYGPVNAVIEYTSPAYSGMETLSIERPEQYLPKNLKIKYKHPNDEPSYDAYRNKKS